MQNLKALALEQLYTWVSEKKIPHIRAGMVEDLEGLILKVLADTEARLSAQRTISRAEAQSEPQTQE